MKGIVFSEFIEMVEEQFSPEMADQIIEASDLPSGGAYTAVGTYHHDEMLTLVNHLSEATGQPASELVQAFGRHLAGRFASLYPEFFDGVGGTLEFLEQIENHVHVEVRKLYPDAELPSFDSERRGPDELIMTYRSQRPFAPLAEGLIRGCAEHWNEGLEVAVTDLSTAAGSHVRFHIRRLPAA